MTEPAIRAYTAMSSFICQLYAMTEPPRKTNLLGSQQHATHIFYGAVLMLDAIAPAHCYNALFPADGIVYLHGTIESYKRHCCQPHQTRS